MIFAAQRFLEDHFTSRGLRDPSGYAVALANSYDAHRVADSETTFARRMSRMRTTFFSANSIKDRKGFEKRLLAQLDQRFKKKRQRVGAQFAFPGGVANEARALRYLPTRRIGKILTEFVGAIESRALDSFWESRAKQKLVKRPETVAQSLLEIFLKGVLREGRGFQVSQAKSGIGYIDVIVVLASVPHVVELKVLTGSRFRGPAQLANYMQKEGRREGWLVVFDARAATRAAPLPAFQNTPSGRVQILTARINPTPPSREPD